MEDPYYSRKPIPKDAVADEGLTGLTPDQEYAIRERKYSRDGKDLRKFVSDKGDPYYSRKKIPDSLIAAEPIPGLNPQEALLNRERKFSRDGKDLRKFWNPKDGKDPYYASKRVDKTFTAGIGETGLTPSQESEVRERKQSMFQLGDDPFQQIAGRRSSSATPDTLMQGRRRSSAVAPDLMPKKHSQSGKAAPKLETIQSRKEEAPVFNMAGPGGDSTAPRANQDHLGPTDMGPTDLGPTDDIGGPKDVSHTNHTNHATNGVGPTDATSSGETAGTGTHGLYHDAVTGGTDVSNDSTAAGSEAPPHV